MIDADSRDDAESLAIGEGRGDWLRLVRNRKQRERYGPEHPRRRRDFARHIEGGEVFVCLRCEGEIGADQEWELDHERLGPVAESPVASLV